MGERINASNARELGRQGGRKSGEVRRERKSMKETLELILSMPLEGGRVENLEKFRGFRDIGRDSNLTVGNRIAVNLVRRAMSGDLEAMKMIRDQIGEKPKDEIEITTIKVPRFEGEDELED